MNVSWSILNSHSLCWTSPNSPPFYSVNLFTICIDNKLFFIDSGPFAYIFEILLSKLPSSWSNIEPILILTHHDFDHSLGHVEYLNGRKPTIFAHNTFCELMNSVTSNWIAKHQADFPELPQNLPPMPNFTISQVTQISDNILLIPTPGHTADSISVFDKSTRALYAGDAIEIENVPYIGLSGSAVDWCKSIDTIISLDPSTIYVGHGGPVDPKLLIDLKKYFIDLQTKKSNLSKSRIYKRLAKDPAAVQIHEENIQKLT